jgi:hypothetical protein
MKPTTEARLTLLERAAGQSGRDETAIRAALDRYRQALDFAVPGTSSAPLPVSFGDTLVHAFALASAIAGPLGATREVLRPARVREAHMAANTAAWKNGGIQARALGAWRDARDAARAIPRNISWDVATGEFVGTLGPNRFAGEGVAANLGTLLPAFAIDAQMAAVDFVAAAELDDGDDPLFRRLHEPLFDAFCAGAFRFWLLPSAIVVAPRLLAAG